MKAIVKVIDKRPSEVKKNVYSNSDFILIAYKNFPFLLYQLSSIITPFNEIFFHSSPNVCLLYNLYPECSACIAKLLYEIKVVMSGYWFSRVLSQSISASPLPEKSLRHIVPSLKQLITDVSPKDLFWSEISHWMNIILDRIFNS